MITGRFEPTAIPAAGSARPLGWHALMFLGLGLLAHLLLSRLGFNPTDDGFILAQSRRLLDGEVPHRDFISIRPVGSAMMHTLDLLLGGEQALLFSRATYWLASAVVCWCWFELTFRRAKLSPSPSLALPLCVTAVMMTTHTFPAMAWHTTDALLLSSIGFLLCHSARSRVRSLGYVLLGAAVLCKQNFAPLLPLAILLQGDARRPLAWAAGLAPGMLYVGVLFVLGAGPDLIQQLRATTSLRESGLIRYVTSAGWGLGVVAGASSGAMLRWLQRGPGSLSWIALAPLLALATFAALTLDSRRFAFSDHAAFVLHGGLCGFTLAMARAGAVRALQPAALFLIALGWCSGISIGYMSPAHTAGPTLLLLLVAAGRLVVPTSSGVAAAVLAWVLMSMTAAHWWVARHERIYRERPARFLTSDLGDVLHGGASIRTNGTTHAVLAELSGIVTQLQGRPYAILVDAPAWWACARERNPMASDWPTGIELRSERLRQRYLDRASAARGGTVFIVQTVELRLLSDSLRAYTADQHYYEVANHVRATFQRTGGTRYWALYE